MALDGQSLNYTQKTGFQKDFDLSNDIQLEDIKCLGFMVKKVSTCSSAIVWIAQQYLHWIM